jgi:anti-sigma B factor antagonist
VSRRQRFFDRFGERAYASQMESQHAEEDGFSILALKGEIDLEASPALRTLLRKRIAAQCPALLLDFTAVEYIDSSGLATLVEYARDARAFGGRLLLAGLNQRVRMVFELVRLHELLPVYGSVAEARRTLSED